MKKQETLKLSATTKTNGKKNLHRFKETIRHSQELFPKAEFILFSSIFIILKCYIKL